MSTEHTDAATQKAAVDTHDETTAKKPSSSDTLHHVRTLKQRKPKGLAFKTSGLEQIEVKTELEQVVGKVHYYTLAPGQVPCENCNEVVAAQRCCECEEVYCGECASALHKYEALKDHQRVPLVVKPSSEPNTPLE